MTCRMSKSADRRERASLAACPLQALKDAGRTAASVMWSPGCTDLCQGPKRVRLKTRGPLRWGQTSQFYLQCSFVSMNSSMTTWSWGGFDWFWVTKITVQSWPLTPTECIVSLSALRVLRWGVAWRLRRPHQLIHPSRPFYCCNISVSHTCLQMNRSDFWPVFLLLVVICI